jgi:propionyl-CoA carboxylase alpha chain
MPSAGAKRRGNARAEAIVAAGTAPKPLFRRILIANRGEIACRVMRTCRRLGIATVAVYSEADAGALHVQQADAAVPLGGNTASESYLKIEKIVDAARKSGAEAVHPGYGFLSENQAFSAALAKAGIVFIGPPADAIAAMGDKIESKKLAEGIGVNTIPGHLAAIEEVEEAIRISRRIGYPVMIKASAGGGGKGMRIAHSDAEVREGFGSARNEARSSFGDDRVFVEKFIGDPRHIEIQILADNYGNAIYLGERDCTIQRRHQKIIEEAPSPALDERTRRAMGQQAVKLAKAVRYSSAGTVEFVVGKNRDFYFLEMNTRLQVEHPVTEFVTGLDLVEQMIRIAAGEKLALAQKDIKIRGHAVEARIYAEDPSRGFMPSIGRLSRYRPPAEGPQVRVDTGVFEGAEISMYYDPMIAKLIGHGGTREEAIAALGHALDEFEIDGVRHNVPFLSAILRTPRFRSGRLTTGFIAEEYPEGFRPAEPQDAAQRAIVGIAALAQHVADARNAKDAPAAAESAWVVCWGRARHKVRLAVGSDEHRLEIDGKNSVFEGSLRPDMRLLKGRLDGQPIAIQIERRGNFWRMTHGGASVEVQALAPRIAELFDRMPAKAPPDFSRFLLSPMPGLLISVAVAAGQEVRAGEELATVEAMKMENVLRATRDGKISKVLAARGQSLSVDQAILEFE